MMILIMTLVIIYIYARKHKLSYMKAAKKVFLKAAAVVLSGILVVVILITELLQKLLDKVGAEGKKMASAEK